MGNMVKVTAEVNEWKLSYIDIYISKGQGQSHNKGQVAPQ